MFGSASCFLGLQDVEIGFGEGGARQTLAEAVRVLRTGGHLVLLDTFPFERFQAWLDGLPVVWTDRAERAPDVRWNRAVALRAVTLYSEGWVAQMRLPAGDAPAREAACRDVSERLRSQVEAQVAEQGTCVPFGPVRMVVGQKL